MKLGKIFICISILSITFNLFANDCYCPDAAMTKPSQILQPGENTVFTVEVKNDKNKVSTFNWTVSNGTIIKGQGTSSIIIDTKDLDGQTITATVQIGGWCAQCDNTTISETAEIMPSPKPVLVDKFTRGNCEDVLARMDYFFTELSNNPMDSAYFIAYGKPRIVNTANREASNWIKIRRFDASRLTIIKGGGDFERAEIEMWRVPPGADAPEIKSLPEAVETTPDKKDFINPKEPYIFSSEYYDGIAGCGDDDGSGLDLEGYARMLKESPKSRGNIVIKTLTKTEFREKEKEILQSLTEKGIARKRLRTFHQRVYGGVELWVLP